MPDDYGVSSGFQSGFDAFQNQMARRQQQQQWDLNFMNQTGQDPQLLLKARQAMQQPGFQMPPPQQGFPQQQQGGFPQQFPQQPMAQGQMGIPPQQQMQTPLQGQQMPLGAPQGGGDMFAQFQNFMSQGRRKAEAGVQDVEAQARERNAQADWMERRGAGGVSGAGGAYALSPVQTAALKWGMSQNPPLVAPAEITSRGPKAQILADGLASRADFKDWYKKNPDGGSDNNFNPMAADIGYGARKIGAEASSRLTSGGSSQVVARTAQAAKGQFDILRRASDDFSRANVQALNTPLIAIARQSSPEAQAFLTAVNGARYEYATALARGNKPGEEDMKEATKAIPDTITPAQLPAALNIMEQQLDETVRGQMTPAGRPSAKSDMVRVISPEGKSGTIPRSKLPAALKRGFKQAQ